MKKNIIIGVVSVLTLALLTFLSFSISIRIEENRIKDKANGVASVDKKSNYKGEKLKEYIPGSYDDTLKYINQIMNSLIIADDDEKWGYIEPTKQNLLIATDATKKHLSDIEHYEILVQGLNDIINGNYESAVDVHNIAWKLQDGSLGEAIGLNEVKIQEMKSLIDNQ